MGAAGDKDLQFVSGTANQPSGYFNKKTGVFTPLGGGGPEVIKDTLTQKQTFDIQSTIQANQSLLTLATQYKELIEKKGFTSPIFGNKKVIGEIDSLRGQLTAAYKDAKKLGTLDIGVQNLVEQIIGERPVSIYKNIFGGRSKKIISQLNAFVTQIQREINQNKRQIGEAPQILNPKEREELEELLDSL